MTIRSCVWLPGKTGVSIVGVILIVLSLSSCATPVKHRPLPPPVPAAPSFTTQPPALVVPRRDISHVVAPGETLWRIGKMYDVPARIIMQANGFRSDNVVLEKGQRLLVPNAAPIQPVISLYPSKRWKYIVVHHSATDEGDSLLFDTAHRNKGWDGVGYHFVIDNGTKGRTDGQIEVSPRWLKQLPGAHCKADNMNERAIGICLVGNFNGEEPSARQMAALTQLVRTLREYYGISRAQIMGHGHVNGAKTDCPGKIFPWKKFMRTLD